MDTDITSKMLIALTSEGNENTKTVYPNSVNLNEMIKYLNKYINTLSIADRKSIGNVLVQNGKQSCMHACEEGTAIHLDPLPMSIIEKMYNLVVDKRSKQNQ